MPALASEGRKQLENVCVQARDLTEAAARAALKRWAVDAAEPFEHFLQGEFFPEKRVGYDIFVRWKPLAEQSIGWNPDLNDGVRPNIRPFMTAGILRKNPNIKWTKDRGTEPERDSEKFPWLWKDGVFVGDRVNDRHLTNAEKQAARSAADETRAERG